MVMEVLKVKFEDRDVGALSFDTDSRLGAFEYEPSFIKTGIELSPLKMPLSKKVYSFPELDYQTFKGLPGMIADSLPDYFGNAVMNAWVAGLGKSPEDITPLQRLQYTGKRGMGALTYHPALRKKNLNLSKNIAIDSLVQIAQEVLDRQEDFKMSLDSKGLDDKEAMMALLSVGISAGGARPKAVLAFNKDFTKVRSGQTDTPSGFTHYIMKFDGVSDGNKNRETFGDPMGYGVMEYVYYLMAKKCKIDMMPCYLLDEGKRRHFITERFDRKKNRKYHIQTLNGLAHVSYKKTGYYSYEELFSVARQLGLDANDALQLFRRMVFNIIARNHDDHSKNVSFILDDEYKWKLAPAYDLAYSYKPDSFWVNTHWMMMNGKRDGFTREDFLSFERISTVFSKKKINLILDETIENVSMWERLATENYVPKNLKSLIGENLRLKI